MKVLSKPWLEGKFLNLITYPNPKINIIFTGKILKSSFLNQYQAKDIYHHNFYLILVLKF